MIEDFEWKSSVSKLDVSRKISTSVAPIRNKHSTQLRNSSEGQNNHPQCQGCKYLGTLLSVTL